MYVLLKMENFQRHVRFQGCMYHYLGTSWMVHRRPLDLESNLFMPFEAISY